MATASESQSPTPVICVHPSSVAGAGIFNPNFWTGSSKAVIHSCWSEYSVLHYCVGQLSSMCEGSEGLCAKNIETLQQQWRAAKFDLGRMVFFAQQPDLHIRIEAFFSGVKTLLDLLVQLLSTEKVVAGTIDGFHRDQQVYGGKVLNALRNNSIKDRKEVAGKIDALISEHKKLWIDQVIQARDLLIHPEKGMHQLMFHLEIAEKNGSLICVKVRPPEIDSMPIHLYGQRVLEQATAFSSSFLGLLHENAVPNS